MCMGTSVVAGVISAVSAVVSTAVTVHGQVEAGKQAKAVAQYNSELEKRDADLAKIKANDALAQGQKDQEKARREYRQKVGQMAAKFGANGVVMDSGSALNMLEDTTKLGELDALDIGAQAERKSQDYLRVAGDSTNQSLISGQQGDNSMNNALINAGGSLVSNAGSIGSSVGGIFTAASSKKTTPSASSSGFSAATSGSQGKSTFGNTTSTNRHRGPSYF